MPQIGSMQLERPWCVDQLMRHSMLYSKAGTQILVPAHQFGEGGVVPLLEEALRDPAAALERPNRLPWPFSHAHSSSLISPPLW